MNINTFKRIMKEGDTKRHTLEGQKAEAARLNKQLPITHFPSNEQRSIELHAPSVADKSVMAGLKVLIEEGVEIHINNPAVAPKNIGIAEHANLVISAGTNLNMIRIYLGLPTS